MRKAMKNLVNTMKNKNTSMITKRRIIKGENWTLRKSERKR